MTTAKASNVGEYASTVGAPAAAGVQRVPPQSIEAEAAVLGSMILHAPCIDLLVQVTRAEHFYRPAHQAIYQVLVEMRQAGTPIDLVLVRDELDRRRQLEAIGGVEYLVALAEGVPSSANAQYYAQIVRNKAMLRDLIVAGTEMVQEAYEATDDAPEVVDRAENCVFQIASQQVGQEAVSLKGLLAKTFETLQEHDGRMITGLASGYHPLDELTSGFQKGEMIIVAARPSMGKTSLLLNIAEHLAVVDKMPVAIFSVETSKEQLAQRLLGSYARYDLRQMRRGMISAEDWTKLQLAAGDLEQAPIFIDDSPLLTVLQLRAKARRLKVAHDIQAVFVDYLQLMTYSGRADSRQEQITEISRGIKALARELKIPVLCAAQLNRGPADRPTHRPRMSDLRESGSIEQDADVVSLLHCEDYYHLGEDDYTPNNITELIVAKQRNGPTGVVKLAFLKHCTRFETAAAESFPSDGAF
ncbi:MAG: replicative DNA helicase [Phycisphaerae bacterium]|nr:replicative DNA helicase [Phycisphaerae bacterium]